MTVHPLVSPIGASCPAADLWSSAGEPKPAADASPGRIARVKDADGPLAFVLCDLGSPRLLGTGIDRSAPFAPWFVVDLVVGLASAAALCWAAIVHPAPTGRWMTYAPANLSAPSPHRRALPPLDHGEAAFPDDDASPADAMDRP